jgi:hypothetical protein
MLQHWNFAWLLILAGILFQTIYNMSSIIVGEKAFLVHGFMHNFNGKVILWSTISQFAVRTELLVRT